MKRKNFFLLPLPKTTKKALFGLNLNSNIHHKNYNNYPIKRSISLIDEHNKKHGLKSRVSINKINSVYFARIFVISMNF